MDVNSEVYFPGPTSDGIATAHLDMPWPCSLCERPISPDGEAYICVDNVSICGDCKFLLFEDNGNQPHNSRQRRLHQRRWSTHGDSESTEAQLIEHFSEVINLARLMDHEHEGLHEDDSNSRLHQPTSSRNTPSGSRRWRRIVSNIESDEFNYDSFYGESESNVSFGASRASYGDDESISSSADGVDSDASIDGHTFLYIDHFAQFLQRSDSDSDSDTVWEEIDVLGNTTRYLESGALYITHPSTTHTTRYLEFEGMSDGAYHGNSGDYLDDRGLEQFLEHLAETDSSRKGAPPASVSFVNCLPLILISEDHQKSDGLVCAICKDLVVIGTRAKQLPCLHLYHPSCILPWLSARNSCPLCRYELPTDDIDYERQKLNARSHSRMVVTEIQERDGRDDSSSVVSYSDATEMNEAQEPRELQGNVGYPEDAIPTNGGRGSWLFLAAAPVVSLMGVVFVLWFGQNGQWAPHSIYDSVVQNQRGRRQWWWFNCLNPF